MTAKMKRRDFITLFGGAAAWPLAARAQQGATKRIGVLMYGPEAQARLTAFVQGLQQLGWTVGQNIQVDYRWGSGNPDAMRKYAAELIALAPHVMMVDGSPAVVAVQAAGSKVPIVFGAVIDPVGGGFVESLARPGGDVTACLATACRRFRRSGGGMLSAQPKPRLGDGRALRENPMSHRVGCYCGHSGDKQSCRLGPPQSQLTNTGYRTSKPSQLKASRAL